MNKTNKQAKYNQRHGNQEQIDSNQRGEGGHNGQKKGKGHQGTCIKDPWRVEGGRWGLVGWRRVVVGKWRQLYMNNNKKLKINKSTSNKC